MVNINEVKSCDIHIDFVEKEQIKFRINCEDIAEDTDVRIPTAQFRSIARALSRIAVGMWVQIEDRLDKGE